MPRIDDLKCMFPPASVIIQNQPDLFGFEWYGSGIYPLGNVSTDLRTMVSWMMNDIYPVPVGKIALMKGGSDLVGNPARPQFFTDAINTAATINGLNPAAEIAIWNSDGYN